MKVYVAGPMTGYPQFNFPAFDDAAIILRERGYDVVSPAELDSPAQRKAAMANPDGDPDHYAKESNSTYGEVLGRDVRLLLDSGVEGVFVLPGWQRSTGARLETFVCRALRGVPIRYLGSGRKVPFLRLVLAWALAR